MEVVGQASQLSALAILAIAMVALGTLCALPEFQRLIEQQRSQRAREREYARRSRVEVEL